MAASRPVALPDERGRFGDFGGKFVPETLMAAPAFAALGTRWEVIAAGFRPIRIKHRDKNSASMHQSGTPLVVTEMALLSKVSHMGRTTLF